MSGGLTQDTVVDGRYRIVNRIGTGGMADVWCAEDLQLGRKVALKLLHPRFAEDEEFVERFRREASSAAGLQHPHVVAVYDRGEWEGTYYIAMEFLEGETLKDLILREAPLDPARAADLAVQILRAARFAHRRGIIHRDLKPHNAIVDPEGRVKVTDFGIARAGASDMTQTGSILGTAQYLSPEQAQGRPVSAASDLYAIGIILYEMVTGHVPFDGDSPVTIALKQVAEAPVPPSHLNPSVPPSLEGVIGRALEKDPGARFGSADEFIAALEAARAGDRDAGGAATTAFAPVGVHEVEQVDEPAAAPRRGRRWLWALLAALLLAGAAVAALLLLREETAPVPRVIGADVEAAARRLRNDGFKPLVERVRDDADRDEVIGQDPRPGTALELGSEVTLTVSDGPGTRGVPDVEGLTRRRARSRLRAAGFRVRERREASDEVADGRVIRTLPPIGSEVAVGSAVTIVLSTGPEQVAVPAVVGSDVEDARDRLEAVGLTADVTREETDASDPGTVLRQDPGAGAQIVSGSTVELVVAEEPDDVEVPAVVGRGESEAVAALSSAGLEVNVEDAVVDRERQDGVVLRQSPAGGRRVERGRRVTVVIGRFEPAAAEPEPEPGAEDGAGTETAPADPGAGGVQGSSAR